MSLRPHVLAASLILAVLGGLWSGDRPQGLERYDQRFYLGIAYDLRHQHRFTDGFAYAGGDAATVRPSGMRFTPLYPALLAVAAWLDPRFGRATDCLVARYATDPGTCPRDAGPVRALQFAMAAAVFWMLWWSGWRCAGRQRAGWIALAVSVPAMSVVLLSVDYLMTETSSLFLIVLAQTLAIKALTEGRTGWWIGSGLALGLAVLARPAFELLAVGAIGLGVVLAWRVRSRWRVVAGFVVGVGLPVGPWIVRNALVLHRASLTFGYASHTFVQRLSFDAMTGREYALSFACWLPDGNGIGGLVAGGRHACDRFGWDDHPDSFYAIGIGPMLDRTLAAAGGWERHMGYLVRHYLLDDPVRQIGWHLLVSVPLALRGVAIAHWWGFVLAILCAGMTVRALARPGPMAARFLMLALPAWFMLAVNAGIAVNQVRYNLMLLVPFSVAAGLAIAAPRRV